MNIHPLVVHFPIAFLTLYALLEFVPFKRLTKQPSWFYLKAILLILGVIGAGVAILAGQSIEHQFAPQSLVSLHSKINEAASFLFGLLAVAYVVSWIEKERKEELIKRLIGPVWSLGVVARKILFQQIIHMLVVFIAFILICIGSALGGIIAFGPHIDPFTNVLYNLLVALKLLH